MARTSVTLTTSWQQVATGRAVFTVEKVPTSGEGQILFNDAAADAAALTLSGGKGLLNDQVEQRDSVATYAKATVDGYQINVDEA